MTDDQELAKVRIRPTVCGAGVDDGDATVVEIRRGCPSGFVRPVAVATSPVPMEIITGGDHECDEVPLFGAFILLLRRHDKVIEERRLGNLGQGNGTRVVLV